VSLKEKIQTDLKKAMQEKEADRVSVLRMLVAAILNKEKEKRHKLSKDGEELEKLDQLSKLTDQEVIETISSEVKKRKDSIEEYGKAKRQDLVENEKKELDILMEYMPEQMSQEEIRRLAKEKIEELGASGPQDTGKVMGALMPQVKGKADGNLVNKIVQEELRK
jgi:uncharacterized protein YqeY